MRLHYFQHVPFEGPAQIETWAKASGHDLSATRLFDGEASPSPDAFDWLIVMGGPMGVHDEKKHPWLVGEKRAIEQAIAAGRTVLGICLGAQLIADVLGAKVERNPQKEIGWFPVEKTPDAGRSSLFADFPDTIEAFHWHGDTFAIPPGAIHVARSAACENQAFVYDGRVVALQFHLESTPESVRALIENCRGELVEAPTIQSPEAMLSDANRFATINRAMEELLDRLAGKSKPSR